ncbi:hypothetical protein PXD04_04570 [Methanosphaera sp. ISO3-F5]|uniref:hypothetical protein n=1 Tax=Methanosphaera sp. ISO3-F5 TaxID=1452353 RepID=UPI002B25EA9F|nr:hypothetical protein [Methanosphaera sp. ISO3-F5]WQH65058.1 hypothetical protein PXD04_04570 [Methanosphaera sp. ISO3-F5]
MYFDEANKHREFEFNQVQKNVDELIVECEGMYSSLLKYNDLITYEELYELTDEDKENFIKIRDRAHEMEHSLLHYKEDLIRLVEGDVEWFLTDVESNDNYFDDYQKSNVFFNYFRAEISLALLFDKLKQLNVPRKNVSELHVHSGGGCC